MKPFLTYSIERFQEEARQAIVEAFDKYVEAQTVDFRKEIKLQDQDLPELFIVVDRLACRLAERINRTLLDVKITGDLEAATPSDLRMWRNPCHHPQCPLCNPKPKEEATRQEAAK